MKQTGRAEDWEPVDRWDGGVGWLAHPDEDIRRASHAVAEDGDVWVLDPVDVPGLDDLLAEYGEVAGVAVLSNRHSRDAATVARRHDVAVHLPDWVDPGDFDAPVERFESGLGDTDYEAIEVYDNPIWEEGALFDGETLVVPESLGTILGFRTAARPLGVHPALRVRPPRWAFGDLDPERIVVGHGTGVFEDTSSVLAAALADARRTAPRLYAETAVNLLRG